MHSLSECRTMNYGQRSSSECAPSNHNAHVYDSSYRTITVSSVDTDNNNVHTLCLKCYSLRASLTEAVAINVC